MYKLPQQPVILARTINSQATIRENVVILINAILATLTLVYVLNVILDSFMITNNVFRTVLQIVKSKMINFHALNVYQDFMLTLIKIVRKIRL